MENHTICFQAYRLLIDLANFIMAQATARVIVVGVPPRHDGTLEEIRQLNSLLALDRRFGYKYIGVSCSLINKSVLGQDKVHLQAEGKAKLKRVIRTKIIC